MKTVKSILKKPANEIAEELELDLYAKRFKFLDYVYAIAYSGIHKCDLTDTAINNNISRSWLSRLNKRLYMPLMLLIYKFIEMHIKGHDYKKYSRYMRITA